MPLGLMLEGLYTVQDEYPSNNDSGDKEDSPLSILGTRINA